MSTTRGQRSNLACFKAAFGWALFECCAKQVCQSLLGLACSISWKQVAFEDPWKPPFSILLSLSLFPPGVLTGQDCANSELRSKMNECESLVFFLVFVLRFKSDSENKSDSEIIFAGLQVWVSGPPNCQHRLFRDVMVFRHSNLLCVLTWPLEHTSWVGSYNAILSASLTMLASKCQAQLIPLHVDVPHIHAAFCIAERIHFIQLEQLRRTPRKHFQPGCKNANTKYLVAGASIH